MGWVYATLVLAALGGGGYAVWRYSDAVESATRAQGEVAEVKKQLAGWQAATVKWRELYDELDRDRRQAEKRARERTVEAAEAEARVEHLARELQKVRDEAGRGFLDSPVPLSVRRVRRSSAGCSLAVEVPCPADRGPDPDPRPADEGRHGEGARGGGSEPSGGLAELQ